VGAGRDWAGAHRAAVLRRNGQRVAFLGYSAVIPPLSVAGPRHAGIAPTRQPQAPPFEERAAGEIAAARRSADFVIVLIHWGIERHSTPTAEQRRIGRAMLDAGASAVIGHHPHVLQGIERRGGGVIAYSLGNFVHIAHSSTMESALLTLELRPDRSLECRVTPVVISRGQPRVAPGKAARRILARLQGLCRGLGTPLGVEDGVGRVE
jgi:poly-gamma-glutamate synthesis protein (capsule biosynthesis protein)